MWIIIINFLIDYWLSNYLLIMNKTLSNFTFYLCISLFAFHCGSSESPEIIAEQEETIDELTQYVEDLIADDNMQASKPDLELDSKSILITDLQSELHTNKTELQKIRSLVSGLNKQLDKQIEFSSSELWSSPFSIFNQEV